MYVCGDGDGDGDGDDDVPRKQDGGSLVSSAVHTHAHRVSFTMVRDMETKMVNDVAEKDDVDTNDKAG